MESARADAVLSVRNLVVEVDSDGGPVRLLNGIDFDVRAGEVFGIVGESGSGKSITMLAIMGLLSLGSARIASGEVQLQGRDLLLLDPASWRRVRGSGIAMVFQDPMTSLNPVLAVGPQVAEMMRAHDRQLSRRDARDRAIDLLAAVGIPDPGRRYDQYPHEFSGGMRQRAMIAMAVANDPTVLIADEPTTALDVSIQAQVMQVLSDMRRRSGASMILVTHDLGLIAEHADRVAVMYGGSLMELAGVEALFAQPMHPYTIGLLGSRARPGTEHDVLRAIEGQPPEPQHRPGGCVFHPRCAMSNGREPCFRQVPATRTLHDGRSVHCHFPDEAEAWRQSTSPRALPR